MSEKTRLRFRRIEAGLLKAFHRGFSLLLAVFIFTLLAIVMLHRFWFAETPSFRAGRKQTFLLSQIIML